MHETEHTHTRATDSTAAAMSHSTVFSAYCVFLRPKVPRAAILLASESIAILAHSNYCLCLLHNDDKTWDTRATVSAELASRGEGAKVGRKAQCVRE